MSELVPIFQAFYREKLAALLRHQAGARLVGQYDFNNTYQYIINREETQLSWIAAAIGEAGGPDAAVPTDAAEPQRTLSGAGAARTRGIFEEDAREAQAFVDRWSPRVDAMTHARHRKMLRVILGETLEQQRFFEQALAGDVDLLGRRTADVGVRVGDVLPTRWVE